MRVKGKWSKGEMARTIVVYLLQLITTVIVWACALKTVAVLIAVIRSPELGASVDLSDVLGSSALTAVVNAVVGAIQKKRGKATTQEAHLAEIDRKLGKMQEHQDEQYLAILRLTIMSEEMPMAERLIAGEKYKKMGGNGDVKKFLHQLEAQCGHSSAQ